ncbi:MULTISPECIES: M81 family metallopeptidase [unclassified Burkholderia]|uniref:M81 family metallopeptidase n=1 Tax=unclassified Burkholderia TaxID=2613784 RepID=UPI002AB2381D|nr:MULTISPECIES: M81 family metallopeptidase [unclassified Burkholderia]
MKILVAGFQHETNTFAPTKAGWQSFLQGEGFPPLSRGVDVMKLRDVNLPVGGFINCAEEAGHEVIPVIWAGASASAHVTKEAYERITSEIVGAVRTGGFDAIYLDLHGAMVAEHIDDGEGELLERVRREIGDTVPIVVSLDLHANVTQRMLDCADAMVTYRTYPHIDMADTGRRAAQILETLFSERRVLKVVARRVPFLIPINGMCTLVDPARGMYDLLMSLERDSIVSLDFAPGFPAADFSECGPVIWGYGYDESALIRAIELLMERMILDEPRWQVQILTPDEAVVEAMRVTASASMPVVIADTQDNPGVGGDSNTMGMVRALIRHGATDAAVGLVWDPEAAAAAHAAGVGAHIKLALGGKSGVPGDAPLVGTFEVDHLSDGHFRFDGPMMNGVEGELGPVACLRIYGVRIAISTVKAQMFDRNLYRVAGIEPEKMKILVNKSSVHFWADFEPIAEVILVAKAPGPMAADPMDLPWEHLDPEIRLRPMGPSLKEYRLSHA